MFRIGNDPALVIVDRSLEFLERKYRLSEGLDHGNTTHIFHRFVGHIRQRVLILGHFVLQFLTGHARHHRKGKRYRYKAQKPQPPIKDQQQRQKPRDRRHRLSLVRKLVGEVGFRRSGSFRDGAAQLAAAKLLNRPQWQGDNMLCHGKAQIRGNAKRRKVRAHQSRNIHQHSGNSKHNCHPAVVRYMDGISILRCDLNDLPQDTPDVPERYQSQQCTGGG